MSKDPCYNHLALASAIAKKQGSMTLSQAAERIGVSASTLCRVKQGKEPRLSTYIVLCKWLEVNPNTFILNPFPKSDTNKKYMLALLLHQLGIERRIVKAITHLIGLLLAQSEKP